MQAKLLLGTAGAIVAAVVGAAVWAAITATVNFQIGYMAIGVGFLCGFAMRALSCGRVRVEGVIAAVVALLGCVLGNLFTYAAVFAREDHHPLFDVLLALAARPAAVADVLRAGFDAMDLLFYAIAAYAAYRTALAPVRAAPAATTPATAPAPAPQPASAPADLTNAP
ncbi:MAG TPA: hypothetical protein VHT05_13390 [Candidatus Elarobacter sp.]|jgi:hypothetical protein|nr:hypothetical protein [Candidatus Elarobacter sp.]